MHTEQSEDGDGDSTGGLRFSLGGVDGVSFGQLDELEYCFADERSWGPSKGRFGNASIRLSGMPFLLASAAFST